MTRASCPWSHRNTDDTGGWEGHCANAQARQSRPQYARGIAFGVSGPVLHLRWRGSERPSWKALCPWCPWWYLDVAFGERMQRANGADAWTLPDYGQRAGGGPSCLPERHTGYWQIYGSKGPG